jgi:hypothetical protein
MSSLVSNIQRDVDEYIILLCNLLPACLLCSGRSAKVDTIGHFDISADFYLK